MSKDSLSAKPSLFVCSHCNDLIQSEAQIVDNELMHFHCKRSVEAARAKLARNNIIAYLPDSLTEKIPLRDLKQFRNSKVLVIYDVDRDTNDDYGDEGTRAQGFDSIDNAQADVVDDYESRYNWRARRAFVNGKEADLDVKLTVAITERTSEKEK